MIAALLGFAGVAALLTITPGVDTALVVRTAAADGPRAAYAAALGVVSGCLIWGVAAAIGASAVLTASQLAYDIVRLAGAGYLVYLGVRMLRSGFRGRKPEVAAVSANTPGSAVAAPSAPEPVDVSAAPTFRSQWVRGLFINLLNPKVGVFYIAIIPQFLVPGVPAALMGILLALIHNIEGMIWFTIIIAATIRARMWVSDAVLATWTDRIAGTVLVAFGLFIAGETAYSAVSRGTVPL